MNRVKVQHHALEVVKPTKTQLEMSEDSFYEGVKPTKEHFEMREGLFYEDERISSQHAAAPVPLHKKMNSQKVSAKSDTRYIANAAMATIVLVAIVVAIASITIAAINSDSRSSETAQNYQINSTDWTTKFESLNRSLRNSIDVQFVQQVQKFSEIESHLQQLNQSLNHSNMTSQDYHFNTADFVTRLNKSLEALNSSIDMLLMPLVHNIESRLQQLRSSLDLRVNYRFNSVDLATRLEGLNNSIDDFFMQLLQNNDSQLNSSIDFYVNYQVDSADLATRLEGLNISLDTLFMQLVHNDSEIRSQLEQMNLEFTSQINDLANKTQQISDSLAAPGRSQTFPASSCAALLPSSHSGYYWVRTFNGSAVRVYCDMTRSCGNITGGWMRVAELDITNTSHQCPNGFREQIHSYVRSCVSMFTSAGCSPDLAFNTAGVGYTRVCGKVIGFQIGHASAFRNYEINRNYVDGVSLTQGRPRQHIWTFAADMLCPCSRTRYFTPPSFVGTDYFCDVGSNSPQSGRFYGDPLWDGTVCRNYCCTFNNPPWFYKQLPELTSYNIDMRVCRYDSSSVRDIALASYTILVQ